MINAFHVLLYSADPAADRAFLRDVLDWPHVVDPGSGDDWLIFKLPPAELGVHPVMGESTQGSADSGEPTVTLHLMCDDIESSIAELTSRGANITGPVTHAGFGLVTGIRLPGGGVIGLYEPRHQTAYSM